MGPQGGAGPRLHRCAAGSSRDWKQGAVRADRSVLGPGGWGDGVLEPAVLAGTNRVVRRRDRLHVACRVGSGLWDQSRGETPAVSPCVRTVGRRQGRSEDGRTEHALARCDRGAWCPVRGRLTKLVAVVGSRRRGPAAGLRGVFGYRVRVAGMSAPAGAAAGETASPFVEWSRGGSPPRPLGCDWFGGRGGSLSAPCSRSARRPLRAP